MPIFGSCVWLFCAILTKIVKIDLQKVRYTPPIPGTPPPILPEVPFLGGSGGTFGLIFRAHPHFSLYFTGVGGVRPQNRRKKMLVRVPPLQLFILLLA